MVVEVSLQGFLQNPRLVGAPYMVSGDGLIPSRKFTIYPNPGPFAVRAQTGSRAQRIIGIAMIPVGGAAILAGATMAALSFAACISCTDDEQRSAATPGMVTLLLGVPMLLAGVALASNDTTLSFGSSSTAATPRLRLGRAVEMTPSGIVF